MRSSIRQEAGGRRQRAEGRRRNQKKGYFLSKFGD
jgi:hypothetical protein